MALLSGAMVLNVMIAQMVGLRVKPGVRRIHTVLNETSYSDSDSPSALCAAVSFGRNGRGLANTYTAQCFQAHPECVVGLWPVSTGERLNAVKGVGPACCYRKDKPEKSPCYKTMHAWYGDVRLICESSEAEILGECKPYLDKVDGRVVSEMQAIMNLEEPVRALAKQYRDAFDKWSTGDQEAKADACEEVDKANEEVARVMTPLTKVNKTRPIAQMFNNMKTLLGLVQTDGGRAAELANTALEGVPGHGGMILTGGYAITRGILNMYTAAMKSKQERRTALGGGLVFHYCDLVNCMVNAAQEVMVQIMDPLYGDAIGTIGCSACSAFGLDATGPFMRQLQRFFEGPLAEPTRNLQEVCNVLVPVHRGSYSPSFHESRLPNFDCFETSYSIIGLAMGRLQKTVEIIRQELSKSSQVANKDNPTAEEALALSKNVAIVSEALGEFDEAAAGAVEAVSECEQIPQ